jgi:hypothetical protein
MVIHIADHGLGMAMTELLKNGDFLDVGDTKEVAKTIINFSMDVMVRFRLVEVSPAVVNASTEACSPEGGIQSEGHRPR